MNSDRLVATARSSTGPRLTNESSPIYVHTNDPKFINKGINAACLQHVEGGYLPYISDASYEQRKIHSSGNVGYSNKTDHGSRPMHRTTFLNNSSKADFNTHNQNVFKGFQLSYDLASQPKITHQMNHQFKIGTDNSLDHSTYYRTQFFKKHNNSDYLRDFKIHSKKLNPLKFNDLRKENTENLRKNRFSNVDEVLHVDHKEPTYFSEYKRYHSYLGYLRGPGEPREFPDRQGYNVLTGNETGPSWSTNANYKRISGNVVLHDSRKEPHNILS